MRMMGWREGGTMIRKWGEGRAACSWRVRAKQSLHALGRFLLPGPQRGGGALPKGLDLLPERVPVLPLGFGQPGQALRGTDAGEILLLLPVLHLPTGRRPGRYLGRWGLCLAAGPHRPLHFVRSERPGTTWAEPR